MHFSLILAVLETWAPIAVIVFVMVVFVLLLWWPTASQRRDQVERFDRWLRERQARSPRRVWIEILLLAVATALLVTLIDWWISR